MSLLSACVAGGHVGNLPNVHRLHIGCSGWNYDHWRNGVFYPPRCPARRWLTYYAERFDTVEVNSSFYRLPRRDAVARWVEQTPEDFVFAVKVSRYLTHIKRLRGVDVHLPLLLERIRPLSDAGKLGPLLWQLPPTFVRDDGRLAEALASFPTEFRHAVEFRHESWFAERPLELLAERGVALVIADGPARRGRDARSRRRTSRSFVFTTEGEAVEATIRLPSLPTAEMRSKAWQAVVMSSPISTTTGRGSPRVTRRRYGGSWTEVGAVRDRRSRRNGRAGCDDWQTRERRAREAV